MKINIIPAAAVFLMSLGAGAVSAEVIATQSTNAVTGNTTTTYYYTDYDANNNGILDSDEFPKYVSSRWDLNHDGFVTDAEWQASTTRWFPKNVEHKTYTYWDKDADGRLDANEISTVVTTTKLYSTWDSNADATIGADEYSAATFRMYDTNGDGMVSRDEWAYVR